MDDASVTRAVTAAFHRAQRRLTERALVRPGDTGADVVRKERETEAALARIEKAVDDFTAGWSRKGRGPERDAAVAAIVRMLSG